MVNRELIAQAFPAMDSRTLDMFDALVPLYAEENAKVNLISRKDFENFISHHVLHSLAIARFCEFTNGQKVIDIGTGGGFPGIPLAILYPEVHFTLCDSIGKKIKAVDNVAQALGLKNVTVFNGRTEQIPDRFDIATARAVAPMLKLWMWMQGKWTGKPTFYLLKGGDLQEEMNELLSYARGTRIDTYPIASVFSDPFFETKKVLVVKGR